MVTFNTNKLVFGFVLLAQFLCFGVLHITQRLAEQAYQTVIPKLTLPRFTEIALHTTFIATLANAVLLILVVLMIYRRASPLIKASSIAVFVSVELIIVAAVCWAYLLPFGYMTTLR